VYARVQASTSATEANTRLSRLLTSSRASEWSTEVQASGKCCSVSSSQVPVTAPESYQPAGGLVASDRRDDDRRIGDRTRLIRPFSFSLVLLAFLLAATRLPSNAIDRTRAGAGPECRGSRQG
jgi:hypothetical protein